MFTQYLIGAPFASITLRTHCICPLTDLIDFAWGALEIHCRSVRSVCSVACVKKLSISLIFRQQQIRRPIRLCPQYIRHALCHPPTDVCSVNAALLHQCRVAWNRSAFYPTKVLWKPRLLRQWPSARLQCSVSHLPLDNTPYIFYGVR